MPRSRAAIRRARNETAWSCVCDHTDRAAERQTCRWRRRMPCETIFCLKWRTAMVDLAGLLGVGEGPGAGPLRLVERIREGLPVSSLDHIAREIAPDDRNFRYRLVPRSSLARRQLSNRLSPEEGARLAPVANLWGFSQAGW